MNLKVLTMEIKIKYKVNKNNNNNLALCREIKRNNFIIKKDFTMKIYTIPKKEL